MLPLNDTLTSMPCRAFHGTSAGGAISAESYFADLIARLDEPAFATMDDYANKFVAHSADARSREHVGRDIAVTAHKFAVCHDAIKDLVDLTLVIAAMNAFNRLGAPFRLPVAAKP